MYTCSGVYMAANTIWCVVGTIMCSNHSLGSVSLQNLACSCVNLAVPAIMYLGVGCPCTIVVGCFIATAAIRRPVHVVIISSFF
jgi:hypothetical protein